jgi:hypothetical protein
MEIHIKNMVCDRCIMTVKQIFGAAGFENADVEYVALCFLSAVGSVICEPEVSLLF